MLNLARALSLSLLWLVGLVIPAAAQSAHFGGFTCRLGDCTSHAAGYRWAERERIADAKDCRGLSIPVLEGCRAYVKNPQRGADRDDEGRAIVERGTWPRALPAR